MNLDSLPCVNRRFGQQNIKTETFKVYGECIQCKNRIEGVLKKIHTNSADWSIETKMLTVSYDSTKLSRTQIEKKIAAVGHDTEDFTASDKVYEKLPPCCLYVRKNAAVGTANNSSVVTPYSIAGTVTGNEAGQVPSALVAATITDLHSGKKVVADSAGFFQINSSLPVSLASNPALIAALNPRFCAKLMKWKSS